MTKEYFTELASYNNWTDEIIINWLLQLSDQQWEEQITSSFSSIQDTVLHMVSAKKVWVDFWTKVPNPIYLSAVFSGTREELISIWQRASEDLQNFMENYQEENYQDQISVTFPNGREVEMMFWQTLPHFVNHATYHRGQLVTMLRQVGFVTFNNTDLFTYFLLPK
jgi:uncharacterized damage-inducible protein DinB